MTSYQVVIGNAAKREAKKLPRPIQFQVTRALEGLAENPRPRGAEKLQGRPAFFRLRCGEHRIIYSVRSDLRAVVVVVIRDRKDAFRGLEELDSKLANALIQVADTILDRASVGEHATISIAPWRHS